MVRRSLFCNVRQCPNPHNIHLATGKLFLAAFQKRSGRSAMPGVCKTRRSLRSPQLSCLNYTRIVDIHDRMYYFKRNHIYIMSSRITSYTVTCNIYITLCSVTYMIKHRDQFGRRLEWQSFPLNGCIRNLRPCTVGSATLLDREESA